MNWRDYITADPNLCHGAPCFKGTRVMVAVVLDNLASGMSIEDVVAEYPPLTPEVVPAAIAYAAELARERIVDLPGSDAA